MALQICVVLIMSISTLISAGFTESWKQHLATEMPTPAIGDIRLVPYIDQSNKLVGYYEVLIYYSDGIEQPSWGSICGGLSEKVGTVICRQLGYDFDHITSKPTNRPVWFKDIVCDENDPHILRCKTTIAHGTERTSLETCNPEGQERSLIKCMFDNEMVHYDGEITLCPPDIAESNTNKTSSSFGVVSLYLEEHQVWRGINQNGTGLNSFLGSYEADSICRQMGFTGAIPGSAITINASGYTFGNCYREKLQHSAWLTTDRIECTSGNSQQCFGCCYQNPTSECDRCNHYYDLVISCVFDIKEATRSDGGNKDICLEKKEKCIVRTKQVSQSMYRNLGLGLGLGLAGVLVIIIIALVAKHCHMRKKLKKVLSARRTQYGSIQQSPSTSTTESSEAHKSGE